jgi:hypothetical protein
MIPVPTAQPVIGANTEASAITLAAFTNNKRGGGGGGGYPGADPKVGLAEERRNPRGSGGGSETRKTKPNRTKSNFAVCRTGTAKTPARPNAVRSESGGRGKTTTTRVVSACRKKGREQSEKKAAMTKTNG